MPPPSTARLWPRRAERGEDGPTAWRRLSPADECEGEQRNALRRGYSGSGGARTDCRGLRQDGEGLILYRAERSRTREAKTPPDATFWRISRSKDASESDVKRGEREHRRRYRDGHDAQNTARRAKRFTTCTSSTRSTRAPHRGDIHIHDLDFLTLTTTCTQIDLTAAVPGRFSTGHGVLREPQDIGSYSALACIAIQSNQNDQHGGQAIASFDYDMAPGVAKTIKEYRRARRRAGSAAEPRRGRRRGEGHHPPDSRRDGRDPDAQAEQGI